MTDFRLLCDRGSMRRGPNARKRLSKYRLGNALIAAQKLRLGNALAFSGKRG